MNSERWDEVERIFAAALERPEAERDAFVRASAADPKLVEEVLSLLAADGEVGVFDGLTAQQDRDDPIVDPALDSLMAALADRYEIESKLGEGGMATVYLARDLKHDRKVAIKVLKPELAAVIGAGRFLTEIQITASLQHPHILPLHDSGESDGILYYVMPRVEGESLKDKLDRERQLPLEDALRIASGIASALDYAHRRGVIHRDIKPANILLQDGQPLVADFGIALAAEAVGTERLTATGLAIGTPQYMSPERAAGDGTAGRGADVYALGCVLYEMLTGEPPYNAATMPMTLAKILEGSPVSPVSIRKSIPANVDAVVRKALERLPADRFTSGGAFASALEDRAFRYGADKHVAARSLWNPLSIAATAAAVVLLAGVSAFALSRPAATPPNRYVMGLGESNVMTGDIGRNHVALSPDGSRLAYVGLSPDGSRVLWLKERHELRARALPLVHASQPFFSPDGERVAVTGVGGTSGNARGLGIVSFETGSMSVVADVGFSRGGGDWSDDGWLYIEEQDHTLLRFSEITGELERVADLEQGEFAHSFPNALPGGRGVIYTIEGSRGGGGLDGTFQIAVLDLETRQRRVLTDGGMGLYASSGHVVVVRADGSVVAAPFDLAALDVTGPFVLLFDNVAVRTASGSDFALSENGDLVYTDASTRDVLRELVWVERDGTARAVEGDWAAEFESATVSPDGSQIAVAIGTEAESSVWVKRLDGTPPTKLTFAQGGNHRVTWMPGGDSITFISDRTGLRSAHSKRADGAGSVDLVLTLPKVVDHAIVSHDDRWLVYRDWQGQPIERDIFARRRGPDSTTVTVAAGAGVQEYAPALSPDGRFIAYVSDETGDAEVWVQTFPDVKGGRWQVSLGGGRNPVWARVGSELFYRALSGSIVVVRFEADPTFSIVTRDDLFPVGEYRLGSTFPSYDMGPDGRFVMIRTPTTLSELVVIENFGQELIDKVGR